MNKLFSPEVKQYIWTRDWPKGLILEVEELSDPSPHLKIIFFRDNWLTLSYEDQMKVHSTVKEVMHKLWKDGIHTYAEKEESSNG